MNKFTIVVMDDWNLYDFLVNHRNQAWCIMHHGIMWWNIVMNELKVGWKKNLVSDNCCNCIKHQCPNFDHLTSWPCELDKKEDNYSVFLGICYFYLLFYYNICLINATHNMIFSVWLPSMLLPPYRTQH